MAVPGHLLQFLEINTAGRVVLLCHRRRIFSIETTHLYTNAIKQAVLALCRDRDRDPNVLEVDRILNEQLEMLDLALSRPPVPRLPPREKPQEETGDEEAPKPKKNARSDQATAVEALSMEEKLQVARKPLRELLVKDCVQLRLVDQTRAKALANGMAGRKKEEAEADIVAELRDNLHQQIRSYMRKHKGGPWDSVRKQEDLRLDITHTNTVHNLVVLARQLLKERKDWEGRMNKGLLHNLLGGKLKASQKKS
jgi:hypothetical protein